MALKARMRRWLAAASEDALADALAALRGEFNQLANKIDALQSRCAESEARYAHEIEDVRTQIHILSDRLGAQADRVYATVDDLADVMGRLESGQADINVLRVKLTGVTDQLRWESEDLRKALAAIAERAERERKAT